MKIAYLTSTLSPAAGGLAVSVPAMSVGLNRRPGIEAHVLGTRDPSRPEAASDWGPHVHSHAVTGPRAFHFARTMSQTLKALSPDLVDVQGLWTYPSLASLAHHKRTGHPYVVTPRGMLDPWARNHSRAKKKLVRLWFQDSHLHRAACLRATAEMEAEHFRSFGLTQPIAVVPNGVQMPRTEARHDGEGCRRLLFLSRVHPKKGIPELLRAWQILQARHPGWDLVVAGPDEVGHTAEMQVLAARLALPRVSWPGPVTGAEKAGLYESASVFVLPTHAENFGLVVAEALSYAIPVVTTRNAPWEGLERRDCGRWIALGHEPLVASLDALMSLSDEERRRMGQRGRDWMSRDFGWDAVADQMAETYHWVLSGGQPPSFVHTS